MLTNLDLLKRRLRGHYLLERLGSRPASEQEVDFQNAYLTLYITWRLRVFVTIDPVSGSWTVPTVALNADALPQGDGARDGELKRRTYKLALDHQIPLPKFSLTTLGSVTVRVLDCIGDSRTLHIVKGYVDSGDPHPPGNGTWMPIMDILGQRPSNHHHPILKHVRRSAMTNFGVDMLDGDIFAIHPAYNPLSFTDHS